MGFIGVKFHLLLGVVIPSITGDGAHLKETIHQCIRFDLGIFGVLAQENKFIALFNSKGPTKEFSKRLSATHSGLDDPNMKNGSNSRFLQAGEVFQLFQVDIYTPCTKK